MRKVMSTTDVAHAWANQPQPQDEARSNSLSFDGPSIFSYSMELARICKNKRGDRAKREREKANQVRKDAARRAADVEKFRAFKLDYVSGRNGRDFLRYNPDKKRIETSQGVQIPVTVGKRLFSWMMPLAANGGCAPCDYKILNFQVSGVYADRVEVGCHTVYLDEVKQIADQLGW